ncbi:non-ribosomal peptide synthetase [Rhodococcus olei]|uniref:Non-ribosomal peptide synthetase n=1 Tax=Rhodococcus olei TaxID=2161675 RepID=A0ABP8NTD2_9NOCA
MHLQSPSDRSQRIPAAYLRSPFAPAPRTLLDVLTATAQAHPDAPAIDDGDTTLTYAELLDEVERGAQWLGDLGVGGGDRVGIRMPSGSHSLYTAILSVLAAGAAYVPVDADDPDERAELVFGEAQVAAILTGRGVQAGTAPARENVPRPPTVDDDAWIIFTSGSTGTPKGVAVSHRSAAAFVDAEARMFLPDNPIGPGDRVLAGLSVAFDASCEEMWLAWRNGACLVPAPRALVRSGMDLGPWLVSRAVTVVSTVPTLAALWPAEALEEVRLLIFGGEACPPELAERLAVEGREVWNTYGPTEATVVACAAEMDGDAPVSIGLPLDGWDLAVVDGDGTPVAIGEVGELVIGGVGLARYLDPAKDAEKYAPMPSLGWDRAYRSGDLVRLEPDGLLFQGRADDQVKIGGRRIELGEVDNALQNLPGVAGAAAAVRTTASGHAILVGYLASTDPDFDLAAARAHLADQLPAALVPRLALVSELPTRTSGKVDRAALPWPLPGTSAEDAGAAAGLAGTAAWVAGLWSSILGAQITGGDDDFFAAGGGSLAAAQLVTALRERFPEVTVAELYDHPRLGSLAEHLDSLAPAEVAAPRHVEPTPRSAQWRQILWTVPLTTLTGLQWVTWLAVLNNVLAWFADVPWAPTLSWWWVLVAVLLFITPLGRMGIAVTGCRLLLRGLQPGTYPRGGPEHLRLWLAHRLTEASGAANLSGAPWMIYYARALGARVGRGVDLHTLPPVTGMLELGDGCSVEPEVDLSGHWIDGDVVHVGGIRIGAGAAVGARSTLLPGARIGKNAEVAPGSAVIGRVKAGQSWAGSPAVKVGKAVHPWPAERPRRATQWVPVYGLTSLVIASLPLLALAAGIALIGWGVHAAPDLGTAIPRALAWLPVATLLALLVFAALTVVAVRALGIGLTEGYHPVRSRVGWQVWATERLLDSARTFLFPLYAGLLTPMWLRLLGARIGKNVEASTVLLLPKFTTVADGAFLADDTMVASYELGGGWLHIQEAKVGKRAFLGNSGMAGPGRRVPKNGLVAVLSAAPSKAKSGSSWLGSPPVRLRRSASDGDAERTFAPPTRLKIARGAVETCRLLPVMVTFGIGLAVLFGLQAIALDVGFWAAALLSGILLLIAGAVAGLVTVVAKWVTVGRIGRTEHPLWSSFVWRNEVSDAFVETVAAPWFARAATGTAVLNVWLRGMGATIGRGVWCESYWLPEADLVTLGDGATVERGCVVQTHLFHDRIMAMDTVTLGAGATLGPHCVALPASGIGDGATVGPASLVMRGDVVPPHTRWQGNPIGPWTGA